MTARVVSSSALPFDVRAQLGDGVELVEPAEGRMSPGELASAIRGADALIAILRDRIDDDLLAAAPRLRVVANVAVGYDNVDVAAATRRGIFVTNTPDVLTDATADLAFALLLAAARRLGEGERLVRGGRWTGWELGQLLGQDVSGRTLGLVGMGRIGAAVAERARGFSMRVLYTARTDAAAAARLGAARVPLGELFSESDFVSLHCPLTPETRHIVDADALRAMKPTAVLVNTARGACVDEAALAAALARGDLAAAGLDVFEREPEVHPDLVASDRVVLAPHVGSATRGARRRMTEISACAVRDALAGRIPATAINPEVCGG